ncbi:5'-methylthioadenosine/S-adenosylhomocysteine nucleosidase [Paraburkholderia sp. IMGN_8]|uniref:5'-methylthioadenosine/S-adenosylhomocysteine nucleosidase family protein n=1 Tax=Paraburkholderia sp. IMGN_8 TaxID=3136564 RepID=UPI003100F7AA
MTPEQEFRPLYLDAVNRNGESLTGVEFTISTDAGEIVGSVVKQYMGFIRQFVSPPTATVSITAKFNNVELPPVKLTPSRSDWTFKFSSVAPLSVLIVCALPLETQAVLKTFDAVDDKRISGGPGDPNSYRTGCYRSIDGFERRVLLATSGMGNSNAAILAIHALRSFHKELKHVIMVGIAGGCPSPKNPSEHVRLGDVVVADERGIIQYDFVKRTIAGDENRAHPQKPDRRLVNAVHELEVDDANSSSSWKALIKNVAQKDAVFKRPSARSDVLYEGRLKIPHPPQSNRRAGEPLVHRGAIGSANILLKDPSSRDRIRDKWNVRAIEMEGSGVQDAAWSMEQDIMVVRGVCDYCDSHKNDTWQRYAALAAASYTRGLLESLPETFFS